MTSAVVDVVFILLVVQTCTTYAHMAKSSLTFVIDDTGSMYNDIAQVKEETNAVFHAVLTSNSSQIENFVLVTFNDPGVRLRTITKNREEFKRALSDIYVDGGDDCPEYAMKGIELALEKSLPRSFLYVFTDASAKDYYDYERIKALAQSKQSRIVFLLTGKCSYESSADYQVYYKMADATSGQVFNMDKDDVKDVLAYVKESITNRGEVIVSKKLPPGYKHKITYPVDSDTGDVLISATGDKPKIGDVTGPDGIKPKTVPLVEKDRIAIVKVVDAKVGDHEVEVGSRSETHVVLTAKTSIHFEPGFSTLKPTSMKEVATKPPPDGNSYLAIQLEGEGAKLVTAKILDLSDNVIAELPLDLVDEKEKFYVTPSFDPPHSTFRVAVTGYDIKTGGVLTRTSPTPIERQNIDTVKKDNVSPEVIIEGETNVIIEYDDPLQLKCKVHGYPKPDIIWEEKETGTILPSKVSLIEVPYDYISVLDIPKADRNSTYECKAKNYIGEQKKIVQVWTKRTPYFKIIETPQKLNLNYNSEGKLTCKVDSYPPSTTTWYINGKYFDPGNPNMELSSDKTVLTIKHMQPELAGHFICEVTNDLNRKVFYSHVDIYGLEAPVISKDSEQRYVVKGTNAELSCRILKGIPKPTIKWFFQQAGTEKFIHLKDTSETISFRNVDTDRSGSYKCTATNAVGGDVFVTELFVEYPPKIKDHVKEMKVKDGDKVVLPCEVDGVPAPEVQWYFNGTRIENTKTTRITADHSLKFKATVADIGTYVCEAKNVLGMASKSVHIDVYVPINIEIPKKSTVEAMVGKSVKLPCRVDGYPKPDIKWIFHSIDPRVPPKEIKPSIVDHVYIRNVQLDERGYYTCIASNKAGESANITYEVKVFAPPIIENVYRDKTFRVVNGDLALRIQCKVTGSPDPAIMWMKDGSNVALGTEWYDMDADGTIIIKNISPEAQGTYVCLAENVIGQDSEMYDVVVEEYPRFRRPATTILTETGVPLDLECDIPHKRTDLLRWYKDGKLLTYGELHIPDVTNIDEGQYSCRVSDFFHSRSAHKEVKIGFKPSFVTDEEENITFKYKEAVYLICDVRAEPEPKVSWTHNGKKMPDETDTILPFEMSFEHIGEYICEVSNKFGTIRRRFIIESKDCILNIKKDFPDNQPLIVTSASNWSNFTVTDGYVSIQKDEHFNLHCPTGFSNAPLSKDLTGYCEEKTKININDRTYDFKEIKCVNQITPEIKKTSRRCLPGDTEYIKVGYKVYERFLDVYDVCLDKENNIPLFAKQNVYPGYTDVFKPSEWMPNELLPLDFNRLYDCYNQVGDITSSLGKGLTTGYSCCFGKRQLVDPRSLLPSIPSSVAFTYLNVVPHWSTCSTKNWDDVEQNVRKLAQSVDRSLTVTTGIATKPTSAHITLRDSRGGSQPVGQYLWKVVQDPLRKSSVAIIQVNIPDLKPVEAHKHVLCRDICDFINWMPGTNWHNVKDGFTYCCTISKFEEAFNYRGVFSRGMNNLLDDASSLPEYYLTA